MGNARSKAMAKRAAYYERPKTGQNPSVITKKAANEEARLNKINKFMKNIENTKAEAEAKTTAKELARRALINVATNRKFNTKKLSMFNRVKAFGRGLIPASNPNQRTVKQKRLDKEKGLEKEKHKKALNARRASHKKNLNNAFEKLQTAKNKIGNVGLNVTANNVEAFEKAYKKYGLLKQNYKSSYNENYNAKKFNEGYINDFYKASEGRRAARTAKARKEANARAWARNAGQKPPPRVNLTPAEEMAISLWGPRPKDESESENESESESSDEENSEDNNDSSSDDNDSSSDDEATKEAKKRGFSLEEYENLIKAAKGQGFKADRAQARLNSANAKIAENALRARRLAPITDRRALALLSLVKPDVNAETEPPGQLAVDNAIRKAATIVAKGESARAKRAVRKVARAVERDADKKIFEQQLVTGALGK